MARGKIIAGADGVFSKTASLLGEIRQSAAFCAQYHLRGIEPLPDTCEIFFNTDYAPGGYVWIYPTGEDSAKVGLGITEVGSKSAHKYLDAYTDFLRGNIRIFDSIHCNINILSKYHTF
ncbi:MAG: digeranylgeranylglycerophospholipid reductase [Candidatus Methanomarinus sp.]|jgi:digeranylgeranylglycerophospholipid reductase|nr:MAG: digeranylgeranylglycerophospholipid reductase [ANME-2 cluster archaeon]